MKKNAVSHIRNWAVGFLAVTLLTWAGSRAEAADMRKGEVTFYISMSSKAVKKVVKAFNKRFPNIKVNWIRSGSTKTTHRFVAERQAGRIIPDLIHSADAGGFYYFAQKGWLTRTLADLPLTKKFRPGFVDKKAGLVSMRATGIALMYNTKKLKKADLPKSWLDLLDPKWKGKIAVADPTRAGSSFSHLYAMWQVYGEDYLRKLGKNEVLVVGGGTATRNAVAKGERVLAPVSEYGIFRLRKKKKPVNVIWPSDGTIIVPSPLGIVKGGTHPKTAQIFAEFMLSREGQQILADTIFSWSARTDVKAPKGKPELDDLKILPVNWSKAHIEKNKLLDLYFKYVRPRRK